MATTAAMVSTGVGAAGALRPQSSPVQPEGKVGDSEAERAVRSLAGWLPVSSARGMNPLSTVATSTTTRHQRHRDDMAANFEGTARRLCGHGTVRPTLRPRQMSSTLPISVVSWL